METKIFYKNYLKLEHIGRGANAHVYKVKHAKLGHIRAIKILNDYIEDENDSSYQSFLKECKTLLKIGNGNHPNIVRIYGPDLIENHAIVEMDYIKGVTLDNYIKEKRYIGYDEIDTFIHDIVGALAYTHRDIYRFLMTPEEDNLDLDPNDGKKYLIPKEKEQELVNKYGIVHNDLHSNNVMRCDYDGRFVLLDFGLSKQNGVYVKSSCKSDGSPEYKAPEKYDSEDITPSSDVYSLGVLLYEVLTGRPPFVLDIGIDGRPSYAALNKICKQHKEENPPSIYLLRKEAFESVVPGAVYERDYPEWLDKIIMKCLSKSPKDRYTDARELLDDINRHKNNDKSQAYRSKDDSQNGSTETDQPISQPQDNNISTSDISKGNNKGCYKTAWGVILVACVLAVLALVILWRFHSEDSSQILLEEIILPSTKYELTVGDTLHIVPQVKPANATDTIVKWESSDPNIVRNEGNNFIAVNKGQSIVTVTNKSGTVTSNASILVNDIEANVEHIGTQPGATPKPVTPKRSRNTPPITSNKSDVKPAAIEIPDNIQDALNMLIDNSISTDARLNSINRIIEIYFEQDAKIRTVGETDIILDYENVEDFLRRIALSRRIASIEIIGSEKHEKLIELSVKEKNKKR